MLMRAYITLLSKPCDKAMVSFRRDCWQLVDILYSLESTKILLAKRLECVKSIYVKTTGIACVSDKLCR